MTMVLGVNNGARIVSVKFVRPQGQQLIQHSFNLSTEIRLVLHVPGGSKALACILHESYMYIYMRMHNAYMY